MLNAEMISASGSPCAKLADVSLIVRGRPRAKALAAIALTSIRDPEREKPEAASANRASATSSGRSAERPSWTGS